MTNSMPKNFTRAFSLIEMMIVIGIIAILAGLTLGISNAVLRGSEIRKTEDAITLLDTALQEWELEMGRSITFQDFAAIEIEEETGILGRYDMYNEGIFVDTGFSGTPIAQESINDGINQRALDIWNLLNENEASKAILAKIHPNLILDIGDGRRVVDAWQNPIGIIYPGIKYSDQYSHYEDRSGDLSVIDQAEDGLGSCINLRPYFVSAGPDGTWGHRHQTYLYGSTGTINADLVNWPECTDNIYSYEPFIVEEAR